MSEYFPDAFVDLFARCAAALDPSYTVVRRPIRENDPHGTVGVFEMIWAPMVEAIGGPHDPMVQRYRIGIQVMAKHAHEELGRALGAFMAKNIRLMLYRDAELRSSLPTLTDTSMGVRERVSRWGIESQEFVPMELEHGAFVFLGMTSVWIETESHFE